MNYPFPEIRHLGDVLPHIQGRDEFIVAEREFGYVVNYVVAFADTFDMASPDDVTGAIRRECRGIKFDTAGNIIARPFHKFFNIGEREETQPGKLDFTAPHQVLTKLDGSMIHPILHEGQIRWCSKMGFTEVAEQINDFTKDNKNYLDFSEWCIKNGLTPIFEWTSRKQKIVIDYPEDGLTLLAVRNNVTGQYLDIGV